MTFERATPDFVWEELYGTVWQRGSEKAPYLDELYDNDAFFTICNYEQVIRDHSVIERVGWDLIILDEGQRIKNWEAKTSRVVKALKSRFALVLSGTPLENRLRRLAGEDGYAGGFIEHYLIPVLYPIGLTRELQIALGVSVVLVNVAVYGWILARRSRRTLC